MKKIKQIIPILAAGLLALTFTSCELLTKMADSFKQDFKDWWGDPVAEQNELKCGLTHDITLKGKLTHNNIYCDHIDLKPSEGVLAWFYAYNFVNGKEEYEYKGHFFYQEDPSDYDKGTFWIDIQFVWDKEKGKWTTPGVFTNLKYNEIYFKAENVNLTEHNTATINATTLVTEKEFYDAKDKLSEYIISKHSDPKGITMDDINESNVFKEDVEQRLAYIQAFDEALESHNPSSTRVSYEKVGIAFTYVATIDGSTLELMLFKDGELFFYPYDGQTENTYMMGMYSYNMAANKFARRWIRQNFTNIGALYDELKEKANTAYNVAKEAAKESAE